MSAYRLAPEKKPGCIHSSTYIDYPCTRSLRSIDPISSCPTLKDPPPLQGSPNGSALCWTQPGHQNVTATFATRAETQLLPTNRRLYSSVVSQPLHSSSRQHLQHMRLACSLFSRKNNSVNHR
ncbi:hypothetical protein HZ326_2670 [Fusarium oxysporum f. sp. albedinis]|nr:hypothetical protein HZ326_2670 [Fusarium oxysporum f. sp. albedinis]